MSESTQLIEEENREQFTSSVRALTDRTGKTDAAKVGNDLANVLGTFLELPPKAREILGNQDSLRVSDAAIRTFLYPEHPETGIIGIAINLPVHTEDTWITLDRLVHESVTGVKLHFLKDGTYMGGSFYIGTVQKDVTAIHGVFSFDEKGQVHTEGEGIWKTPSEAHVPGALNIKTMLQDVTSTQDLDTEPDVDAMLLHASKPLSNG